MTDQIQIKAEKVIFWIKSEGQQKISPLFENLSSRNQVYKEKLITKKDRRAVMGSFLRVN